MIVLVDIIAPSTSASLRGWSGSLRQSRSDRPEEAKNEQPEPFHATTLATFLRRSTVSDKTLFAVAKVFTVEPPRRQYPATCCQRRGHARNLSKL
jgi:hypothetical protein